MILSLGALGGADTNRDTSTVPPSEKSTPSTPEVQRRSRPNGKKSGWLKFKQVLSFPYALLAPLRVKFVKWCRGIRAQIGKVLSYGLGLLDMA